MRELESTLACHPLDKRQVAKRDELIGDKDLGLPVNLWQTMLLRVGLAPVWAHAMQERIYTEVKRQRKSVPLTFVRYDNGLTPVYGCPFLQDDRYCGSSGGFCRPEVTAAKVVSQGKS